MALMGTKKHWFGSGLRLGSWLADEVWYSFRQHSRLPSEARFAGRSGAHLWDCLGMLQGLFFRFVLEEYLDAVLGVRLGVGLWRFLDCVLDTVATIFGQPVELFWAQFRNIFFSKVAKKWIRKWARFLPRIRARFLPRIWPQGLEYM